MKHTGGKENYHEAFRGHDDGYDDVHVQHVHALLRSFSWPFLFRPIVIAIGKSGHKAGSRRLPAFSFMRG